MEKPNIFALATKELSQDAFFTWLLQWADEGQTQYDQQLNETAQDFVRLLLGQSPDFQVNKVIAGRQWNKIDIWAEVNDGYFIGIEDKTNTCEHSEQLERYKEIVMTHFKDKKHQPAFVYLKTGNESLVTLEEIKKKGYSTIDRSAILSILNKRQITNEIFNDFKDYLTIIENETNSWAKFGNITSKRKAGEGFFIELQKQFHPDIETHWQYVANQTGGFLGFWYHFVEKEEIGKLYIQIENALEYGEDSIKLVIKIGEWAPSLELKTETLCRLLNEVKPYAEKNGLSLSKPNKYRVGSTSTLAVVQNAFPPDSDRIIELDKFMLTLKSLEKTLHEYCNDK
jgi:hypothetical protein